MWALPWFTIPFEMCCDYRASINNINFVHQERVDIELAVNRDHDGIIGGTLLA